MKVNDFDSFQQFLRVNNVFDRFGVKRIGVFGSFVRGGNYNDIDLMLENNLNYNNRIALKEFLESSLQIPIDIMVKDYTEPIILHRALKDIKYATSA